MYALFELRLIWLRVFDSQWWKYESTYTLFLMFYVVSVSRTQHDRAGAWQCCKSICWQLSTQKYTSRPNQRLSHWATSRWEPECFWIFVSEKSTVCDVLSSTRNFSMKSTVCQEFFLCPWETVKLLYNFPTQLNLNCTVEWLPLKKVARNEIHLPVNALGAVSGLG